MAIIKGTGFKVGDIHRVGKFKFRVEGIEYDDVEENGTWYAYAKLGIHGDVEKLENTRDGEFVSRYGDIYSGIETYDSKKQEWVFGGFGMLVQH